MSVSEKDAVSAEAAVKFAKLAFSYEHWEAFDAIIAPLYSFLQVIKQSRNDIDNAEQYLPLFPDAFINGGYVAPTAESMNMKPTNVILCDYQCAII